MRFSESPTLVVAKPSVAPHLPSPRRVEPGYIIGTGLSHAIGGVTY